MKSRSKKRKGCVKEVDERDRLSELPDEVLVHILSYLPTIDAVRTMLLRRFGNLWTLVTSLDFDANDFDDAFGVSPEHYSSVATAGRNVRGPFFHKFVCNVLMFHRVGKIHTFKLQLNSLRCWERNDKEVHEMQIWIQCAMKKEPEIVHLSFSSSFSLSLPLYVLNNPSLVELVLKGCVLEEKTRVHMRSLRSVSLFDVIVDTEAFREFFSGSPQLKELTISSCYCSGELSLSCLRLETLQIYVDGEIMSSDAGFIINCPNLKILSFRGGSQFLKPSDLSSVCEASFMYDYEDFLFQIPENAAHFTKLFLEMLHNTEFLKLDDKAFQQLTLCSTQELGFPCNRWKHVNLKLHSSDFVGICSLVKNSPYLEELVVCDDQWECDKVREELFSQEVSSPCVAPRLKSVHIVCSKELDDHLYLLLAKYLLTSAVVLDKLVFRPSNKLSARKKRQLVKRFSDIPRASLKAKVLVV